MQADARKAIEELKRGNARNLDSIIRFLAKDEYGFRTGYLKEEAWHVLKRATLTERQKQRLRTVALAYLRKRIQREFWYMCRFIHRIADSTFRSQVEHLTKSKDERVRQRAVLLNAYLQRPDIGGRLQQEFWYQCARSKYRVVW